MNTVLYIRTKAFNPYNLVLYLFILINILELFVPRQDDSSSLLRLPIQLINILVLAIMWNSLLHKNIKWNPITISIFLFLGLVVIYGFIYVFIYQNFPLSELSPYMRLLVWGTAIIFFHNFMIRYGLKHNLMQFYIITFIASIFKKILEASYYQSEKLGGGDTASLPLLFIISLSLVYFSGKYKYVIVLVICSLILLSLRRTAILALISCIPFIYKDLKANLKAYQILVLILFVVVSSGFIWYYLGDALIYRFTEMIEGNDRGAYGSGRSDFYLIVWDNLWKGDASIFFGNGLISVQKLLLAEYSIIHAHNDFLEIGYTFGLVGLLIWFTFLYNLWKVKRKLFQNQPDRVNLFYICFISFLVISLASGSILRITTVAFSLNVALLLYYVNNGQNNYTFNDYHK